MYVQVHVDDSRLHLYSLIGILSRWIDDIERMHLAGLNVGFTCSLYTIGHFGQAFELTRVLIPRGGKTSRRPFTMVSADN